MLFLLFYLGQDCYALEAAQVAEVVPFLSIKQIPLAATGVAGMLNYRGEAVPVIDLSVLTLGSPSAVRLSTRIVLVHYADSFGGKRLLGLIAEKVTETVRLERTDFAGTGIANRAAPYLGPVAATARGMIQWVEVANLLPDSVREILFQEP
ncbi:MAG: cheW-like domain protein, partial [Chthoniobacteraceae bacterium]|nr:cheW-like domain protein [Chthoniobacteraceae bacterium]